jgi:hypothetical protein
MNRRKLPYVREVRSPKRRTPVLYRAWMNMWGRVRGQQHDGTGNYRWKGLPVADEWKSYDNFRVWALAAGFCSELRSLDRTNEKAGYSPANCEWVTKSENCRRAMRSRWS